jgi:ring-1,2-phenylacetyl-CoA epoxidase subunit PaaC
MTDLRRWNGTSLPESAQRILELADDELILGWRNSEWTGIAPFLEEDVAFSSIAQTEIGHARAWYELAAKELGTDADALAFDRDPDEYRCAPLVELRLVPDWARTIARHWLYETADAIRIQTLKESSEPRIAGLAEKIDREETDHRMHADMWADRLRGGPRFRDVVEELWPYALGLLEDELRPRLVEATGLAVLSDMATVERGGHTEELRPLWEEMTMVRRSVPGATW